MIISHSGDNLSICIKAENSPGLKGTQTPDCVIATTSSPKELSVSLKNRGENAAIVLHPQIVNSLEFSDNDGKPYAGFTLIRSKREMIWVM